MKEKRQIDSQRFENLLSEIKVVLPNLEIRRVLDVGANKGQSVEKIAEAFPGAEVHAFEPAPAAFDILAATFGAIPKLTLHRMALGAKTKQSQITNRGSSTSNKILEQPLSEASLPVDMMTGDEFCADRGIATIQLLKIDTEGYDYEVLRGFEATLGGEAIDLIQVEASLNPDNKKHVGLRQFERLLYPLGYRLFGIYEIVRQFTGIPHLRRCNPVFISRSCANRNTPIKSPR
jgi:FkbM family methyltransferase